MGGLCEWQRCVDEGGRGAVSEVLGLGVFQMVFQG